MSIITWSPSTNGYNTPGNWSTGTVPDFTDAALFGASAVTNLTIAASVNVGEWVFGASQYSFTLNNFSFLSIAGAGLIGDSSVAHIIVNQGNLIFYNYSTAGNSSISFGITGNLDFEDWSTSGSANIQSKSHIIFDDYSSAATATIHILSGGFLEFNNFSSGGSAKLLTDPGATVDFFPSAGPAGNHALTIGSIAGAGTYNLGADQLIVGSNLLQMIVSGSIDDGSGTGGSVFKVGRGRLSLTHSGNTFSGGTTIEQGAFEVAAIGAAGTGPIRFAHAGKAKATLEIDNAALSAHVFATNPIDLFGKHDVLDVTGLHFRTGATATYHKASHHLTVHSGHVTDTLTLLSPHGTHFHAASDHHGGTDVFLFFA